MISDLKEYSNKHMYEVKKSIQDLNKKYNKKIKIFWKETEILEMKNSINQIFKT
jgi:hypothetical protein